MTHTGDGSAASQGRPVLEAFDFAAQESAGLRTVADCLSTHALPAGDEYQYFRQ